MKFLYNIGFVILGALALLLGWNMGVHSRMNAGHAVPFESPESLTQENQTLQTNPNALTIPVVPSIALDEETDLHLEEFRSQARKLQKKFPDVFFICGPDKDKKIALTFDDGPDGETTPAIIKILNEFEVKATFFVTGQNAKKHPEVVQSIYSNGHQVANHSYSHPRPLSLSTEELLREISDTNDILHDLLGIQDYDYRYFRPPYGLLSLEQLTILKTHGYLAICWSIDSMDWYASSAEEIKKCVVDSVHPGAIILLHSAGGKDGRINTVKALPGIIEELSRQGFEFVTIDELLGRENNPSTSERS